MTLKGVEEVNNIINDFVSQFDCTSRMGTDFSYIYDKNIIEWSFLVSETADSTFTQFLETNFPDINCNIFLWSLLHEIGHHETCDIWEVDEQEEFDCEKDLLEMMYNRQEPLDEELKRELCLQYYEVPDEVEATYWAANYLRDNENQLREFWDKLQEQLVVFCELNNIQFEDDD